MKSNDKTATIVIGIIFLIIVFSLVFILFSNKDSLVNNTKVLDPIFTTVKIENGAENLSVDITLEFENSNSYDINELQAVAESSLRDLNYDELKSSTAIEYLEQVVYDGLKEEFPEIDDNMQVLITDVKMGYLAEVYEEGESNSGNDEIYKGLFQGIGDWSK